MRNNFAQCLTQLAVENTDLVLLYSDSGNNLFNPIKEVAGERVFNVGIAEANMISVAAGMALNGHHPVTYAITPFTSARNFEQIKVDVAYQNLPVVIVGTGSGLAYANLGPTHHSFEDVALMRTLPNMQIVCPADSVEIHALLPQIIASKKPTYFRIGKKREPNVVNHQKPIILGQPNELVSGSNDKSQRVLILCSGVVAQVGLAAAETLETHHISTKVVSFHTIKPLNTDYLTQMAKRFDYIVTLEEHALIGGFSSALLEFYNDADIKVNIKRFGIPDSFIDRMSGQKTAWQAAGLTPENVVSGVLQWF